MSMYLNVSDDQGRDAFEIATLTGWRDFQRWAVKLPKKFALVKALALKMTGTGSKDLEAQLRQAVVEAPPGDSPKQVLLRLAQVCPYKGNIKISDEPEDDELDEDV